MLRAGFTDVLSIGIVIRWTSVSISPTVRPVKPTVIEPRLVLAITKTNSAVNTTSTRMTTPRSKPPATAPPLASALGEWLPYPFDAKPVASALNPLMLLAMTKMIPAPMMPPMTWPTR